MRVTKGCPICQGDVLGTKATGFFCKGCNLLFDRRRIVFAHAKQDARKMINTHFKAQPMEERPKRQLEPIPMPSEKPDASFLDRVSRVIKEDVATLRALKPAVRSVAKELANKEREEEKKTAKRKAESKKKGVKKKAGKKKTAKRKAEAKKKAVKKKTGKKSVKKRTVKKKQKKRVAKKRQKGASPAAEETNGLERMLLL